ncbi:helix-turn-helix transcriptional regulator [Martelella lutilitoris]|uniref:Helix-turn-helix transcriptional regulator n=1 Tax=Martelella lutilitoris TaxID=2583532 RepID=A0A7T7HM52_9HYPH|nr:helix-turn-helix transcriptional regulator [Martelella lutilitoris]QQM31750.1 helix-turn-helix transcriptional regulator [Martelella lutilitoris]
MMSFSLGLSEKDRATGRFKSRVNRGLIRAVLTAKKKKQLTQSDIARLMEIDKSTLSKILNGKGNLTLKTIGDLAWAVGLTPHIEFREKEQHHKLVLSNSAHLSKGVRTKNADSSSNFIESGVSPYVKRAPIPHGKNTFEGVDL